MVAPTMDTLPRVPDTHGDTVNEKIFSDLYIRTSWVDANVALDQIKKGKARGRRSAIYMRSIFQSHLQTLGFSVQKHAGKVLFVAILVLSTFCVGLKSATIHSKVHQLWIQEGGRLEQELLYTQKSLGEMESTTHQLLIQTPKDPDASVLHSQALLTHLEVLRQATSVTVQMFDITWSLRDMCNVPTIPLFDAHYIEQIFENIIPCSIVTPLDCFWEGSKLLGPEYPAHIPGFAGKVQWTSLNPQNMLANMKSLHYQFPFDTIQQYMKRAGISTGYTEKPCLDPKDPLCPETAPNKQSLKVPDVGAELTGGCYSYAAKYMHWPEELIVGGAERNRTGHLKKAKALQTVIQLMTEREMYEFWNGHYKVHHIGWTPEKAAQVLNSWQKKFSNEVTKIMKSESITTSFDVFAFSSATLDDILAKYSNPSPMSLGIAIAATIIYSAITLIRWKDPVKSQSAVGIAGVLLIGMSTAAGLGLCALLGIPFNAATFQVVPFLALGLGVGHIFTLTHAYAESNDGEQTKDILKKAGPTVLFAAATTIVSFFAAVLIPVPALKVFCLQASIVIFFNLASALLVFPAMISLDLRRRQSGRADIFCCCLPPWKTKPVNANVCSPNDQIITEILTNLNLNHRAKVLANRLSGGEKRRLSLALELVANPSIFFLDEPTSGLDEVTASQCIRLLKSLARQGKTVVCTIHQPSAISFALFDNVFVLARGKCVYQGAPDAIVPFMSQANFVCPTHYSPSDYIIEICDTEDMEIVDTLANMTQNGKLMCCSTVVDESQTTGNVSFVMKNAVTSMILEKKRSRSGALLEKMKAFSKFMQNDYANSGLQQFLVLFRIMMIKIVRNRIVLAIQLFHHVFCGGIFGLIFLRAADDGNRMFDHLKFCIGIVFFLCYTQIIVPILAYPSEVKLLKKECFNRWYGLPPYYAALTLSRLPFQILFNMIFMTLTYYMSRIPMQNFRFGLYSLVGMIVSFVAEGLGLAIGAAFSITNGTVVGPLLIAPMLGLAIYGFDFANDIPVFMYGLMKMSFMRVGIVSLVLTVFGYERPPMSCTDVYCHFGDPKVLLRFLRVENVHLWNEIGFLVLFAVVFRTVFYFNLKRRIKT